MPLPAFFISAVSGAFIGASVPAVNAELLLLGLAAAAPPAGGRVLRVRTRADRHHRLGGTIPFISALAGVPPVYLTSTARLARFDFRGFLVFRTAGPFLRFAAVAIVPLVIKAML